jgi:hypothetical protein
MNKLITLVLLLACGAAMAVADDTADAQFRTERGAQIALTKIINSFDAALPALTPEQEEYVRREEAFVAGPGSTGGERVKAYANSKELYLAVAANATSRLRKNVATVKSLAGRPERFAIWSDIVMQLSHPGPLENALHRLHELGVIDKSALGSDQGILWLRGPSEGDVQLLWPFWAETMWASWCYEGIADATGASKSLVKHPR